MNAGWDALSAAMAQARAEIAAASPDAETLGEGEAYLGRCLASELTGAFAGHLLTEGGLSRALPVKGGPNPDYLMRHAPIQAARRYRLTGRLNGSERVGVGLYAIVAGGVTLLESYTAFDKINLGDEDDRFSLGIAADATEPGTLAITPATRVLIVRILHRDPQAEPASVRLEGAPPPRALTLAAGSAEGALEQAGKGLLAGVRQFLEWTRALSADPNQLTDPPESLGQQVIGDADTRYLLGYYALQPGEWLEIAMPLELAGYWSLYAYNHWLEALPGAGVHDLGAQRDEDGRVRIALGPDTPAGFANRIDTLGRRRGVLIGRLIGGGVTGQPEALVRR